MVGCGYESALGEVVSPATECCDLYRAGQASGFANEADGCCAVVKLQGTEAEGLGNHREKAAEIAGWHGPDFNLDARADEAWFAHEPRLGRGGVRESVESIVRRSPASFKEAGTSFGQLLVERLAAEMRADNGEPNFFKASG